MTLLELDWKNLVFVFLLKRFISLKSWTVMIVEDYSFDGVIGEQILEISGVYVEPSIMGYGSCSYHGNCSCKWRSKNSFSQLL